MSVSVALVAVLLVRSVRLQADEPEVRLKPDTTYQSTDVVISLDYGTDRQLLARLVAGQWVAAADSVACAAAGVSESIVSSGAPVVSARRVTSQADEWKIVEPAIARLFQQREREHRLTASHLASASMTIEWIYGAASVYYFEASKRVPDPGTAPDDDPKGTLRVAVSGWLRVGARDSVSTLGSKSELRWEQDQPAGRPEVQRPDLLPIGILRQGTQVVWVMKGQIGDIVWFTLYDAGESGVRTLLRADARRC